MLSWLYPETCRLCGEPTDTGTTLCARCLGALPRMPLPLCLYCGSAVHGEAADPYTCDACRDYPRRFDFARSALSDSAEAMQLVHDVKYHRANHLAPALAPLLEELWAETPALREHEDWVLVPVPIEAGKLQQRGYNQAEELARALAARKGLRVLQALRRRSTGISSQTRLSAELRERNAQKAYSAGRLFAAGLRTLPQHLLLVDDVYTTGATLRACAAALRRCRPGLTIGALTLLRMD